MGKDPRTNGGEARPEELDEEDAQDYRPGHSSEQEIGR